MCIVKLNAKTLWISSSMLYAYKGSLNENAFYYFLWYTLTFNQNIKSVVDVSIACKKLFMQLMVPGK
jgi:hypothetical protein